jgi:hypothetical protein
VLLPESTGWGCGSGWQVPGPASERGPQPRRNVPERTPHSRMSTEGTKPGRIKSATPQDRHWEHAGPQGRVKSE